MDNRPQQKRGERGLGFLIFGAIDVLIGISLFVWSASIVSSTINMHKDVKGSAIVLAGWLLETTQGFADAMNNLGLFCCITGTLLLSVGAVREYRRRRKVS